VVEEEIVEEMRKLNNHATGDEEEGCH